MQVFGQLTTDHGRLSILDVCPILRNIIIDKPTLKLGLSSLFPSISSTPCSYPTSMRREDHDGGDGHLRGTSPIDQPQLSFSLLLSKYQTEYYLLMTVHPSGNIKKANPERIRLVIMPES